MTGKSVITDSKKKILVYIVLAIVTLAVYGQVYTFDFVNFDDDIYITENSHVQAGLTLESIRWAFGTRYFSLWNPLVWLSFMLDYQLYGLKAGGYHVTNLILHIFSTLLLLGLFYRMTGALWKSAFVAAVFALHPLHVESVAWISERKDVLSAFFWMMTLCLYVYYTEKPALKRYLLVLFSFVLALMSKPMVVTLPLILILLDYWPLKRFESQKSNLLLWQLKEKLPLLLLAAAVVMTLLIHPDAQAPSPQGYPLASRLAAAPVSFIAYLIKIFAPYNMAAFYPFPDTITIPKTAGSLFLITGASLFFILKARKFPYFFTGWLWYALSLLPVIGIIQIGNHAMADRYSYLPSIGISIVLAWGVPALVKNKNLRKRILFPAAILFLACLALLTGKQCGVWKNSTTLFNHALHVTKDNYIAHNHLAVAMFEKKKFEQAVYHYNKAIAINPVYAHAYYNRGLTFYAVGQKKLALDDFKKAISLLTACPFYAVAYNTLGVVYTELGQYDLAVENYGKAIQFNPDYADAYKNRAIVYFHTKNREPGCRDAKKACGAGNCTLWNAAVTRGFCR